VKCVTLTILVACGGQTTRQADPPPEFHPHPEIAPDEIRESGDGGIEASTPAESVCDPVLFVPGPLAHTRRIRSGPPVTNHIPPEIVMRPVRTRWACYRACVADAVTRNGAVHGVIETQFVVDVDGWVRTSHVRSNDTGDAELGDCVAHAFIGLELPKSESRFTIVYPITVQSN
jgi:hypothetical protein